MRKNYYDERPLSYNDYVEVVTDDIGAHKGYIRSFGNDGTVKVGCLVGELRVPINRIRVLSYADD